MKKTGKKMLLSIIAGVLVMATVIGASTYAWFTSQQTIAEGDFQTAIVGLNAPTGGYKLYEFYQNYDYNVEVPQAYLESIYGADQEAMNIAFTAWLQNSKPDEWLMGPDFKQGKVDYAQSIIDYEAALATFNTAWGRYQTALGQFNALVAYNLGLTAPTMPTPPAGEPQRSSYPAGTIGDIRYYAAIAQYYASSAYISYLADMGQYYVDYGVYQAEIWASEQLINLSQPIVTQLQDDARILSGLRVDAENAMNALYATIFNKAVFVEGNTKLVTPGSIIYGKYEFKNTSNIDTYFRIKAAEFNNLTNSEIIVSAVATYDIVGPLNQPQWQSNYTLKYSVDSVTGEAYYYCPQPIGPGNDITITIGAYIFGQANPNEVQDVNFTFGESGVELIQASNNAVHMVDGWKDLGYGFYLPLA